MTQQRPNREQRRHPKSASEQLPTRLKIRYIKSGFSHVSHADGVFGGMTPHRLIYMAFFAEHAKIPDDAQIFAADAVAKTIKPMPESGREVGWVREVEAEIIMGLENARSFRNWLDGKIKQIEEHRPEDTFKSLEGQQQS